MSRRTEQAAASCGEEQGSPDTRSAIGARFASAPDEPRQRERRQRRLGPKRRRWWNDAPFDVGFGRKAGGRFSGEAQRQESYRGAELATDPPRATLHSEVRLREAFADRGSKFLKRTRRKAGNKRRDGRYRRGWEEGGSLLLCGGRKRGVPCLPPRAEGIARPSPVRAFGFRAICERMYFDARDPELPSTAARWRATPCRPRLKGENEHDKMRRGHRPVSGWQVRIGEPDGHARRRPSRRGAAG